MQVQPNAVHFEPAGREVPILVFDPTFNPFHELGDRKRLSQVVDRAHAQASHAGLDVTHGGEDEDPTGPVSLDDPAQHLIPVHSGHQKVEDRQGIVVPPGLPKRVVSAGSYVYIEAFGFKCSLQELTDA
jgi:hypothetical protein